VLFLRDIPLDVLYLLLLRSSLTFLNGYPRAVRMRCHGMWPYCVLWGSNPRHHIRSPSAAYPSASAPHAWRRSTSDTVSSDPVLNDHRRRRSRGLCHHTASRSCTLCPCCQARSEPCPHGTGRHGMRHLHFYSPLSQSRPVPRPPFIPGSACALSRCRYITDHLASAASNQHLCTRSNISQSSSRDPSRHVTRGRRTWAELSCEA